MLILGNGATLIKVVSGASGPVDQSVNVIGEIGGEGGREGYGGWGVEEIMTTVARYRIQG